MKAILFVMFLQTFFGFYSDVPRALTEAPIVIFSAWATAHVGWRAGRHAVGTLGPFYK